MLLLTLVPKFVREEVFAVRSCSGMTSVGSMGGLVKEWA